MAHFVPCGGSVSRRGVQLRLDSPAPGPGQAPDGVRWAKVALLVGKEAGGPHLLPPPGEGTALLLPAASICWGVVGNSWVVGTGSDM